MDVLFRCGHQAMVDPDRDPTPRCGCGERVIARTLNATPPRFAGHAQGPLVETRYLGALALNLAPTPLRLTTETERPDAS